MANRERPQTLSRALLSLSRINSAESPIDYGLNGFYKARKFEEITPNERVEAKQSLQRFEEFCKGFLAIKTADENGDKEFSKNWIVQSKEGELTPHIEIFLSSRSLTHSLGKKKTEKWFIELKNLEGISEKTRSNKEDLVNIDKAIRILRELHTQFKEASETEKKTSEKILSGKALLT
jgi:hypothetical protein